MCEDSLYPCLNYGWFIIGMSGQVLGQGYAQVKVFLNMVSINFLWNVQPFLTQTLLFIDFWFGTNSHRRQEDGERT